MATENYTEVRYIGKTAIGLCYGKIYFAGESPEHIADMYVIYSLGEEYIGLYSKKEFELFSDHPLMEAICINSNMLIIGGTYLVSENRYYQDVYYVYNLDKEFEGTYYKSKFKLKEKEANMTVKLKPLPAPVSEDAPIAYTNGFTHALLVGGQVYGIFPSVMLAEYFKLGVITAGYDEYKIFIREIA
jgi:hypothetical protein